MASRRVTRRRRNPDALPLGTIVEYGKRHRAARIDARMIRTRTGALSGYLGEEDDGRRLVMLRPGEITGTRRAPPPEPVSWVPVLLGVGAAVGVLWLLARR